MDWLLETGGRPPVVTGGRDGRGKTVNSRLMSAFGLGAVAAALAAGYWAGRAQAEGIPTAGALVYSGVLTDASGKPLSGLQSVQIRLWNSESPDAGATADPLCFVGPDSQPLAADGSFRVPLDKCADVIHKNSNLWADVLVAGESLGRVKLGAVPYALEADHATSASLATKANTAGGDLEKTVANLTARLAQLEAKDVHVAFFAYHDAGGGDQSTTSIWPGNKVLFNEGNGYSTSTYQFTAPVAGDYVFAWNAYTNVAAGRTFLRVNGADQTQTDSNGKAISLVLKLNKGDVVSLGGTTGYPMTWFGAFAHNSFAGYLLAPR